jgi:hypothetical protein
MTTSSPEIDPLERAEDLPRIMKAITVAVREALLRHKLLGNPVAVWQDERVVWIAPEDIRVDFEDEPGGETPRP